MTPDKSDRSLAGLVSDLVRQLSALVQTEGKLLRSELRESGGRIGTGVLEVLVGVALLVPALVILLQALVDLLVRSGLGAGWSAVIVGGTVATVGLLTLLHGRKNLSADTLAPHRSATQLRKDADLVKETTR
jgi:membrane-associated PAP2 superfamily phosphatase